MSDLPRDLVEEEILCRVPATSLKRLRSTCKLWNRLFTDMRFARKHCDKAAKQFLVLMLTKTYTICAMSVNLQHEIIPSVEVKGELSLLDSHPSNNSAQIEISEVFHCDGLLLCTFHDESRIVVWNPFTGETRWINSDKHYKKCHSILLGYYHQDNKSCNKSYKILSFCHVSKASEIYEFNSDSWRILNGDIIPGWSIYDTKSIVSLKGKTYWFAKDKTETHLGISLLRFDFSTERSEPVPLPYQCYSYKAVSVSVVREEKLSVLLQRGITSKTEIWVTNKIDDETKVVSWSKVLELDLSKDLQISEYGSFLLDEEKKVVVCCERWMDLKTESKSMDKIYIIGEDNKVTSMDFGVDDEYTTDLCWPAILNYVSSLVQIKQAAGVKRKRCD